MRPEISFSDSSVKLRFAGVLMAGLGVTALVTFVAVNHNKQRLREAVREGASSAVAAVQARLLRYEFGLRGARGAVVTAGEEGISYEKFQRYSRTRDLPVEFPGARGFGFIRRVPRVQEQAFLASAWAKGQPDLRIRQLGPPAAERFVIQYIEPIEVNREAVGLDVASERNRREAAVQAMRTAKAVLSAPITLVQAPDNVHQSFLLFIPIYRGDEPHAVAEREAAGFGWAFAALSMNEVLTGLPLAVDEVHFALRDITSLEHPEPFYRSKHDGLAVLASQRSELVMFGRRWQLEFGVHPAFVKRINLRSPWLLFGLGTVLSVLIGALVCLLSIGGFRRRQIAAEQARLAALVEGSLDGIVGKSPEGIITSWNNGAEQIFGFTAEQAIGRRLSDLVVPKGKVDEEQLMASLTTRGERVPAFTTSRQRRDGTVVEVSISMAPVRAPDGRVVGSSEMIRDITPLKEAERRVLEANANLEKEVELRVGELRRVNLLLSSVLESASEVSIIATDRDGLINVFNRGAEQLLGYTADDVVGKATPALFHLAQEVQARSVELTASTGKPIEGFRVFVHNPESEGAETREWTYVHKDGHPIPVSLMVTAIRDEVGQITGYLGVAINITDRKAALAALAASLETTRAVLDTAVNPIITMDAAGLVHSINPAGIRAFGYQPEEILGHNISLVLPKLHDAGPETYLARCLREDEATAGSAGREVLAKRKDGSEFPIHLSVGSMSASGQTRFVGIITDVSEQQRQRVELTSARDQLILAAEAAELGVWTRHVPQDAVELNDRMFELYGLDKSLQGSVINRATWLACVHPDDVAMIESSMAALINTGQKYAPVFRVIHPDGRVLHIQAGAQIQRDEHGRPVRITGINRDITAQRELEARLLMAKEQADAASAAKSSFLANMSHEIRTPLNAVLGMLQLVQQTPLEARQSDYVTKAHMAATSLLSLLNDILDYSKIEAGKLSLEVHPFELEAQMNELAVVLSGNQGGKAVEVIFDLDPALPPVLVGDSLRLKQILINLAGNALKFTLQGQVVVSMKVLAKEGSALRLEIAVADTGIGMKPELLERIFEGFTQAEASTSRRFGGTGLGLVICRRLVGLMGGTLHVQSEVDKGSRFWFEVTLEAAQASPLMPSNVAVHAGLRVLFAEDNDVAAELMLNTMRSMGWRVQHAVDGVQALECVKQAKAQGQPFDLLIFDWRMPNLDGLSAARKLHEEGGEHRPVIVMVTAHGREVLADAHHQDDAPFVDFLTKPVTAKQLADAAQRALSGTPAITVGGRTHTERVPRLTGLRLLVVEDNALNRQVAAELLGAEGAKVRLAEGGLEGVARVVNAPEEFDVVLMDVQMPDIDGLEATRRIRSHAGCESLPILAMTANASRADREACLAAGMSEHVGKPIDLDQVVATILTLVPGRADVMPPKNEVAIPSEVFIEPRASILSRLGNDAGLFAQVLGTFEAEEPRALLQLEKQVQERDAAGAIASLHALKGSAGTIGAAALAARAGTLEHAAKTESQPFSDSLLCANAVAELQALFAASVLQLRDVAGTAAVRAPPAPLAQPPLGRASWRQTLTEMLPLLKSGNMRAIDLLDDLQPHDELQTLVHQVQGLAFAAALTTAERLLERP